MSKNRLGARLATYGGGVRWYLRELMGDSRYSRYLVHARSHDPAAVVMSEREYWRNAYREEAANPRSRCC